MRQLLPLWLALAAAPALAQTPLILEGEVADDGSDFLLVPFPVPAGIAELELRHESLSDANILDFGLLDPAGFRGWGGGNVEAAIVGVAAASRSYLPGAIEPGEWQVVIGKAKIVERPARYRLELYLRSAATLAPQPERRPYAAVPALSTGARWYAGDLHVHSRESGDARPELDELATFAAGRGLDFVELSEHNTVSQLELLGAAQERHPGLLFLPGVEFTTYAGHANGIGATAWVDHKLGLPGITVEGAAQAFAAQGALFSVNHPVLDLGNACIGCAWEHQLPHELIDAVEIATGGWSQSGYIFTEEAIAFWDALCAEGHHVAAIGGSDDHRAGVDLGAFGSPIGDPTTLVFAEELSAAAIVEGIRGGRTVVKLQGPGDPMVVLSSGVAPDGDTVHAEHATFTATVTGGAGQTVRFVVDGEPREALAVEADPFTAELVLRPRATGERRVRAEVLVAGLPRTVTSHLWLGAPLPVPPAEEPSTKDEPASEGCGCATGGAAGSGAGPWAGAGLLVAVYLLPRGVSRPAGRGSGRSGAAKPRPSGRAQGAAAQRKPSQGSW